MNRKILFPILLLVLGMVYLVQTSIAYLNRQPYKQGAILYNNFCASCHMDDGSGLVGNIPPLAGADYVADDPVAIACVIRYGLEDTILVNGISYYTPMAKIPQLTEFEITNIINYINTSWGHELPIIKLEQVRERLGKCKD